MTGVLDLKSLYYLKTATNQLKSNNNFDRKHTG